MVDIKPRKSEVEWRPPDVEDKDPIEDILKAYDFQALHDRIMLALEIKPDAKNQSRPVLSVAPGGQRKIQ